MEKTKSVKKEKPVKESNIFKDHKEKRDKISMIDKERLVRAHDEGADYVDLGDKLGLNRHTVNSIISLWRKSGVISRGKMGGHKKPIITDEIGEKLIHFIEQNPCRTLKDLREYLNSFDINPTYQTISNYLHGRCVAIKKSEDESNGVIIGSIQTSKNKKANNHVETNPIINFPLGLDRNSDEVKNRRHDYVKSILDNGISMKQCIFVDECMFNYWIRSPYGKYTKGTREYKHCCGQKETNVTVCMAIATTGVIHYKVYMGSITKTHFEEFILELSMQLGDGHFYIIQDCSPIHSTIVPAFENHQMVFIPPFSSFLNPITSVFARLKAMIKTKSPKPSEAVKLSANGRKEAMKRVIEDVIPTNFYCSMNNDYSATVKYFTKCISKENIEV